MKTDKGFELSYQNLSDRRKFIRTLWMIPFIFIATFSVWFAFQSLILTLVCFVIFVIGEIIQTIYTYQNWKNSTIRNMQNVYEEWDYEEKS